MVTLSLMKFFIVLCMVTIIEAVNVKIDGVIDLGPQWDYEDTAKSIENQAEIPGKSSARLFFPNQNKKIKKVLEEKSLTTDEVSTQMTTEGPTLNPQPRAIKDDDKINEFIYHIYSQSMKLFDDIKKKTNPAIVDKIDLLSRSYDEKFREFVNNTMSLKIQTRLGGQRVILNTINTSKRLMTRLVNYFVGDLQKEGMLRTHSSAVNALQKEIDRSIKLEMMHACSKFGICRSNVGFSDFLVDFFTIIVNNRPNKVKQASDGLTEALKNANFSLLSPGPYKMFLDQIDFVERLDGHTLKGMFWIAKNVLTHKNAPIMSMVPGTEYVKKTMAMLEVVNMLDDKLPGNAVNKLEWADLKVSLTDWKEGKRHDVLNIMQGLVSHIKKRALDNLDANAIKDLNYKLVLLLG